MRWHQAYRTRLGCSNAEEVFDHLTNTWIRTITSWDYYVNWHKVYANVDDLEMDLHQLNHIVGKADPAAAFRQVVKRQPSVLRTVPILLAVREPKITVFRGIVADKPDYLDFDATTAARAPSNQSIDEACELLEKGGIFPMVRDRSLRSLVDYVLGVEVGLDTNGRKNRSGASMEVRVREALQAIRAREDIDFIEQASAAAIADAWAYKVESDKASRRFDFAVNAADRLVLIEVNYYGSSGGSKLKATAGEYKALYQLVSGQGHGFLWLTDGRAWKTAAAPLRETFDTTDHILNLDMVYAGVLRDILVTTSG